MLERAELNKRKGKHLGKLISMAKVQRFRSLSPRLKMHLRITPDPAEAFDLTIRPKFLFNLLNKVLIYPHARRRAE